MVEEEDKDGGESDGESELDEKEEDKPVHGPGLSAKVQGRRPAK